MLASVFGYLFILLGLLMLILPLVLVELSRPRDWLIGGLFLFLGLFLLVENVFLRGSINLLLISIVILYGTMMIEIIQNRWYKLSLEEKKRIGSLERWFESIRQLSQIFLVIGNGFLNFFKILRIQSDKPLTEKKWVRPELKDEIKKKVIVKSNSSDSNKIRNQELTENEETS